MQLTMSSLLNAVKRKLGISFFKLPIDDSELIDVLYEETITTFSIYFPNIFKVPMDLSSARVPGVQDTYYIDTSYFSDDITLIGVENITINSFNSADNYPYGYSSGSAYEIFTQIQMESTFTEMMSVPITFFFEPPNMLRLDAAPQNITNVMLELSTTHPKSLHTIKLVNREQLLKLALLDMKAFLYEILKRVDKIDTTFGQIDLKIDDWANSDSERDTLIQRWDETFLNSRKRKIYKV